jgi:flagellar biogenesis protein FliO
VRPASSLPSSPVLHLLATAHTTHSTGAKTVSTSSLFLHLVLALVVVIGVIALASRLLRGRVGGLRKTTAPLAVLGRQPLGKGVQIAIVRAGTDTYVVGVTSHQVTRLGRFTDPDPGVPVSTDDLPAAAPAGPGGALQSAVRHFQERTVRRA